MVAETGQKILILMIGLLLAVKFAEVMIPLVFTSLDTFANNTIIQQNGLSVLFETDGVMGLIILAGLFLVVLVLASFGVFKAKAGKR